MTGWTDSARQASIESRAAGKKPGEETHHRAIASAMAQRQHFAGVHAAEENYLRSRALHATPAWSDKAQIQSLYIKAAMTHKVVDHIIPLRGKTVWGLNVQTNMRLISAHANHVKGNKFKS
jgi:hypothetical protein